MDKLLIIGTNTTAKQLYDFVKGYNLFEVVGFAVNSEYKKEEELLGLPVYAVEDIENIFDKREIYLYVAMLWNSLNGDRRRVFEKMKNDGYRFANIISPTAIIRSPINGENCWIHDFCIIQNNAQIGTNVIMMANTLIGSFAKIGDHCYFGTKSTVGGGAVIGEQSFVGINCTVFDKTIVGKKCILGACTAVKRNMPDYSLYKTSSDFVIKQYDEDTIEEKLMFSKNKR